jgi:DNA-binding transcriptional LysR family regulator
MTLDQLRIFVAVAGHEHLTRAANALSLSQSAVSSAISALERRYKTRLFDRVGRNIVLNPAGRDFLAEAKAVLDRADTARRVLDDLSGLKRGTIRVGASQTVGNYWLPRALKQFRQTYPGVDVDLSVSNSSNVVKQLEDGSIEVGFVEWLPDQPRWKSKVVYTDQVEIVVAPSHPWATREVAPSPAELGKSAWVARECGSGTRARFEKTMHDRGVEPDKLNIALVLPTNEAVRTAAEACAGAALLSRIIVSPSIDNGALVAPRWWSSEQQFQMVRDPVRHASTALKALWELLED